MTSEQLELFPIGGNPYRLTVSQVLEILWIGHLSTKPSGRTYIPNRKALCRSFGERYFDTLTDIDFQKHRDSRLRGLNGHFPVSLGTVFHDHTVLSLAYSKLVFWKKRGTKIGGVDLSSVAIPAESPTAGVPKTKGAKRRRIITPEEFAKIQEHADTELRELLYILTDTILRLGDALKMKPEHYNPYTDQIEFTQGKTGTLQTVPPSVRVKQSFQKAAKLGRPFVYNGVNLRARFEDARRKAGVFNVQIGRDFRKTGYNAGRRFCKDPEISRQHAGHSSSRTGNEHYYVEEREDLRPVVLHVEKLFS